MDTRPYRLQSVVSSTRWFEVAYPALQEEKTARIEELGASPRTSVRYVGTDLGKDWIPDLAAAGWDESALRSGYPRLSCFPYLGSGVHAPLHAASALCAQ